MDAEKLFKNLPLLSSERVILRKITPDDIDGVFALYSNDEIFSYCGILTRKNKQTVLNSIGHFERDFNQQTRIKWGIADRQAESQILGIIGLDEINKPINQVTVGYFLHPNYWHQGYASEALRILVKYLFEEIGVNRIQAEVMPANLYSKKVLLKNGFLLEGTLRQARIWAGKGLVDLELYSILASDYREAKIRTTV